MSLSWPKIAMAPTSGFSFLKICLKTSSRLQAWAAERRPTSHLNSPRTMWCYQPLHQLREKSMKSVHSTEHLTKLRSQLDCLCLKQASDL